MAEPAPMDEDQQADLFAYLDGQLPDQEARAVEERLAASADLRRVAEQYKKTWDLLDFLPQREPSQTFTSKTLDRLSVVRTGSSSFSGVVPPVPSTTIPTPTQSVAFSWKHLVGVAAAAVVLFAISFGLSGSGNRRQRLSGDPTRLEPEMARDLRVLDQLQLLEYGDDLSFLLGLDQPELFGDDPPVK